MKWWIDIFSFFRVLHIYCYQIVVGRMPIVGDELANSTYVSPQHPPFCVVVRWVLMASHVILWCRSMYKIKFSISHNVKRHP